MFSTIIREAQSLVPHLDKASTKFPNIMIIFFKLVS